MSKVALITGITGQDGSYLAELLLKKRYKVHGIVQPNFLKANKKKNWRIKNIARKVYLHKSSLEDFKKILKIIKKTKPNEIYHLAAQAYDGHSFDNSQYTFKINLLATQCLLSAIKAYNKKTKFFFAGSSEMYGDGKKIPINEKTSFDPRSAYAITKVASYYLIKNYRDNYKMHASTGILFNHESPRRDLRFVTRKISSSVAKIKLGLQKKIKLGNLKAKRDWGHAEDFVKAMWLMVQKKVPGDYIIGTGYLNSVEDFAKNAFKHVDLNYKKYLIVDKKLKRNQDLGDRIADYKKARKILKWKPTINFKALVKNMVDEDLKLLK
jgi:GDPmannose 4,6-dehydratase